ncbi:uncharacterized protein [Amphiura filiformis]|uniref:uncharacterized protein n=1 Tax=Amphiura filiformis TaxID=82378 RepID=UPI003B21BFF1
MTSHNKQARVLLWGVPRSVSTSFANCMTYVQDSVVWFEPYFAADWFGRDGNTTQFLMNYNKTKKNVAYPLDANIQTGDNIYEAAQHDFTWVKKKLEEEQPGKKVIFVKDMIQGIAGHYDALPDGYRHAFVIRHPLKVFASLRNLNDKVHQLSGHAGRLADLTPHLVPPGYFYKEMYDLVEYLKNTIEPYPIIIDADDLLSNPYQMMHSYCDSLDIPFDESLLTWPAGNDAMLRRWICPKELIVNGYSMSHEATFKTTGFGKPAPIPDRSELPDDVLEVADASMLYYDKLFEQRLQPVSG